MLSHEPLMSEEDENQVAELAADYLDRSREDEELALDEFLAQCPSEAAREALILAVTMSNLITEASIRDEKMRAALSN